MPKWSGLSREQKTEGEQISRLNALREAGDDARDRQNWTEAARLYEEVIVIDPLSLDIVIQLGHAHKEMGDYDRAAQRYYAVLEKTPNDDDLHLQIGHLEKLRGNDAEALTHYKLAADLNPENLDARREHASLEAGSSHGNGEATIGGHHPIRSGGQYDQPNSGDRSARGDGASRPDDDPLVQLSATELRAAGDQARDAWLWAKAAPAYRAYLGHVPTDTGIWVQFGHCLKELGDLAGGEAAYRRALAQQPDNADIPLQLGHVLKLLGKRNEALAAYRRSFALKPLRATAFELEQLGLSSADELVRLGSPPREPAIFFEISDLFSHLLKFSTVSGIQRVQLGIISYIVDEHDHGRGLDCWIVTWEGGRLWVLGADSLAILLPVSGTSEIAETEQRRKSVDDALNKAEMFRPISGDIIVSTGAIYERPDLIKDDARLKRAGVRLGAYIHDFIPLTHPEFCEGELIASFSATMADALLHRDFALTASKHVEKELSRLLAQSGYPPIPTCTVPEAHSFVAQPEVDRWTSATGVVQGSEFVLCVGTLSAQKNQALLLQIWRLLMREGIRPPLLVLVGQRGYLSNDLLLQLKTSNNLDGRVHVFEGLSDGELQTLYRNCLFTMFPSFAEGWGLPVGESLAHGKLCIASDAASLPEVGGDFVVYIDPHDARSAAGVVRRLLNDRAELQRLEDRIRSDFSPRTWHEHGAALIAAVRELGRAEPPTETRQQPVVMPFNKVVRPFLIETGWEFGTGLPPRQIQTDRALRRLLLERGWYPMKSWGTWMDGRHSRIGFSIGDQSGNKVRVALQFQAAPWAQDNQLSIRAACGAATIVPVPESRRTGESYPHFLAWLNCTPDKSGRIALSLEVLGEIPISWWGETRRFCVGLVRLLCLEAAGTDQRLPLNRIIRPTALGGPTATTIVPRGTSSLLAALRRRIMLGEGWIEPEGWGAWMAGRSAGLVLTSEAAPGEIVSVVLQLRTAQGRDTEVTVRSRCGAIGRRHIFVNDPHHFPLFIECRVEPDRSLHLEIDVTSRPISAAPEPQTPVLGITGLAYGRPGSVGDRLALAEALLFPRPEDVGEICRKALEDGLRFSVIGHMDGSYSIAVLNRRLALTLEKARPGTIRVEQIEGQPVRNMSRVPPAERTAIAELVEREWHEDGPAVEIVQHWPVWVPPHPADLKLAWVPWEENLVPLEMVRLLNEKFHGILVQTHFVRKALIDSGVRLPIRVMGCALDLDAYAALGAERCARSSLKQPTKAAPFVFLHVSSCFPRKGVNALLAAYAKSFRCTDPVRLVIKGFPNEHNDVPEQIAHLLSLDPEAPEIVMINRDTLAKEVVELYRDADVMVLPTRGEGFNMPAAEALAAGLPLIVTGHSGQTDFAGAAVARQVDFRFAPSRSHVRSYGSVWADPDIDDLAAAMREAFAAAGDPVAQRELAAQVERGRQAAVALGDGAAWASRVRNIAIDLLSMGPMDKPIAPTVAWVTTWNIRCGIATHSKYLLRLVSKCRARRDRAVRRAHAAGRFDSARWAESSLWLAVVRGAYRRPSCARDRCHRRPRGRNPASAGTDWLG